MELRRLLAILRQRTILLLVIVIAGLAASYLTTSKVSEYKATTTIFIGEPASTLSADAQTGQQLLATTFAAIIPTAKVAQDAINDTHVPRSVSALVAATKATVVLATNLIEVSVTDPDPVVAQTLANGVSQAFVNVAEKIAPLTSATGQPIDTPPAAITQPASIPTVPLSTGLRRNLILGALTSALIGVVLVLLIDYLDISARSPGDLEKRLGLPVLGIIPLQPQIAGGIGSTPAATPERVMIMTSDDG